MPGLRRKQAISLTIFVSPFIHSALLHQMRCKVPTNRTTLDFEAEASTKPEGKKDGLEVEKPNTEDFITC